MSTEFPTKLHTSIQLSTSAIHTIEAATSVMSSVEHDEATTVQFSPFSDPPIPIPKNLSQIRTPSCNFFRRVGECRELCPVVGNKHIVEIMLRV